MSGGYVFAGYGITVGSLGLYAVRVLRRGRILSRAFPGGAPPAPPGAASPGGEPAGPARAATGDG